MTSQYKKFIKLISKWPLDVSKGERDLGRHIRERVKTAFEKKEAVNFDTEFCMQQYNALNRLADNKYVTKYKRTRTSTATGLSPEECKIILSNEVLEYLKEENKGFFRKIFKKE